MVLKKFSATRILNLIFLKKYFATGILSSKNLFTFNFDDARSLPCKYHFKYLPHENITIIIQ